MITTGDRIKKVVFVINSLSETETFSVVCLAALAASVCILATRSCVCISDAARGATYSREFSTQRKDCLFC